MIEKKVIEILKSVLGMEVKEDSNLSMQNCPKWDSVAHIDIIMSCEEEFGICFNQEDLPNLHSQNSLVAKIKELSNA